MPRFVKQFYGNLRLSKKMLLSFLLVSVIPILIIQSISYVVITSSMKQNVSELTVDSLQQLGDRMDITIQAYGAILEQIYVDDQIIENINLLNGRDDQGKAAANYIITNRLKTFAFSQKGIRSISIITNQGVSVVYDTKTASIIENLWSGAGDLRRLPVYRNTESVQKIVLTPTERIAETRGDTYVFHLSKALNDLRFPGKGTIAVVVISVEEQILQQLCNPSLTEQSHSMNFILDSNGQVVSYPKEEFLTQRIPHWENGLKEAARAFAAETALPFHSSASILYREPSTGWILCNVYDQNYMFRDIRRIQLLTVILGLSVIAVSILVIRYTVRTITDSTGIVIAGMRKVREGDLNVAVQVEGHDEIHDISSHFNNMVKSLRQSMEETNRAANQRKEAEIRALEAQINPHFLYNTLDSINWMAIEHEEYEISRMLCDLGIILRYSISNSNLKVSFQEEIDWLKRYLELQRSRFNDSFDFEISADPDVLRIAKTYKLLFQPFVENALIHGLQGVEENGRVTVEVLWADQRESIHIVIEDNGNGMSPELVQKYNDRTRAVSQESGSIGMHNAFSRLDMYYKDRASWKIISAIGKGTVINLKIPAT